LLKNNSAEHSYFQIHNIVIFFQILIFLDNAYLLREKNKININKEKNKTNPNIKIDINKFSENPDIKSVTHFAKSGFIESP
tara:strand:- start:765 stop:1007 length:243 start_codon:yes stop_codon:yes gene_type:complete